MDILGLSSTIVT